MCFLILAMKMVPALTVESISSLFPPLVSEAFGLRHQTYRQLNPFLTEFHTFLLKLELS
jgi:hypothetical protein